MAIFSNKKKKTEEKKEEVVSVPATPASPSLVISGASSHILIRPRITEKATDLSTNNNAYVFNVLKSATKKSIAKAVEVAYKVKPLKVAVVAIPRKQVTVRGKRGVTGGGKKAYVYLKQGDKIEVL